jgi:hypothetical protein
MARSQMPFSLSFCGVPFHLAFRLSHGHRISMLSIFIVCNPQEHPHPSSCTQNFSSVWSWPLVGTSHPHFPTPNLRSNPFTATLLVSASPVPLPAPMPIEFQAKPFVSIHLSHQFRFGFSHVCSAALHRPRGSTRSSARACLPYKLQLVQLSTMFVHSTTRGSLY